MLLFKHVSVVLILAIFFFVAANFFYKYYFNTFFFFFFFYFFFFFNFLTCQQQLSHLTLRLLFSHDRLSSTYFVIHRPKLIMDDLHSQVQVALSIYGACIYNTVFSQRSIQSLLVRKSIQFIQSILYIQKKKKTCN